MNEPEYPPLLTDGFQYITVTDIDRLMVKPFRQARRYEIAEGLKLLIEEISQLGLSGEVWVDGSFATRKPIPNDVDVVFLFDRDAVESLEGSNALRFRKLLLNRQVTLLHYHVDVYFIDKNNQLDRAKWQRVFGMNRTKTETKGIFVIQF
ncbi:hypothetical protein GCM10023189_46230 [Nibrella saemangeumensis]|uniref:Polymerase nucleotidyl transferase domain-containing protein n=1 Tax=Nibrella saemangeumensis TaxID=1084526 RepID=A0ABP8NGP6_9BACT